MCKYDKESKARRETILLLADIQRLKGRMSPGGLRLAFSSDFYAYMEVFINAN